MITIFLNVNIQYLLHFQINSFLIYFVVIIISPKKQTEKKTKNKTLVPLRVMTDFFFFVRQGTAGGAASLRMKNLT